MRKDAPKELRRLVDRIKQKEAHLRDGARASRTLIRSTQIFGGVKPQKCERIAVQRLKGEKDGLEPRGNVALPLCYQVALMRIESCANILVSDFVFCVHFFICQRASFLLS